MQNSVFWVLVRLSSTLYKAFHEPLKLVNSGDKYSSFPKIKVFFKVLRKNPEKNGMYLTKPV